MKCLKSAAIAAGALAAVSVAAPAAHAAPEDGLGGLTKQLTGMLTVSQLMAGQGLGGLTGGATPLSTLPLNSLPLGK
ncbi:hypothetical protein AB0I82_33890 [Streptomyces sp. NPDC050315]|uniref:hypothetical protein n=1 Tax=Streptomyces sp. NPDC050315 TaxID=3155039 RepID=UPI003420A7DA